MRISFFFFFVVTLSFTFLILYLVFFLYSILLELTVGIRDREEEILEKYVKLRGIPKENRQK